MGPHAHKVMCSVSIVPHRSGLRIVCNRDEQRERPAAEPPRVRAIGRVRAAWPTDPFSGGTWIGANEAGLAMVLLNRNPRRRARMTEEAPSRGTLIPSLMRLTRIAGVLKRLRRIDPDRFEPFTLLVVQDRTVAVVTNAGGAVSIRILRVHDPLLFTSSSLGDHLVSAPRQVLFQRLVRKHPSPLRGQAVFHRHSWKTRPELSVCMSRADARTVSRTVIDLTAQGVRISYTPVGPTFGKSRVQNAPSVIRTMRARRTAGGKVSTLLPGTRSAGPGSGSRG